MAIPEAPGLNDVRSPAAAVKWDAAPFMQQMRGRMEIGGAVQDIADHLQGLAAKQFEAKNTADLIDAQGVMAKKQSDYLQSLSKNQDETTWVKGFQEVADTTKEQFIGKDSKLAPVVKQRLAVDLKEWQQDATRHIGTLATKATINRGKAKIDNAIEQFTANTDVANPDYQKTDPFFKQAVDSIDEAVKAGFMFKDQGEKQKEQLSVKAETYAAQNYIQQHPAGALDYLSDETPAGRPRNLTNIPAPLRNSLIKEATARRNEWQKGNFQDLSSSIDQAQATGQMTMMPNEQQIQAKEDAKDISPYQAKVARSLIAGYQVKNNKAAVGEIEHQIESLDQHGAKAEEEGNDIRADISKTAVGDHKRLNAMLDNKLKKAPEKSDYAKQFATHMLEDGKFGKMKLKDDGTPTDKPSEEAYASYYETLQKLDEYRQQNPKATFEEERAQLAKWTVAARVKSAHNSFSVQDYLSQSDANTSDNSDPGH